jgi:hypothetical protein
MRERLMMVGILMVFLLGMAGGAPAQNNKILDSISVSEMAAILKEDGITFELAKDRFGEPLFYFKLGGRVSGYKVGLVFYRANADNSRYSEIQLRSGFANSDSFVSMERINEWNGRMRFCYAFMQPADKSIIIKYDINLKGGVSDKNIIEFIEIFEKSLLNFISFCSK